MTLVHLSAVSIRRLLPIHRKSTQHPGPRRARLRLDGETGWAIVVARTTEPQTASIVCFVKTGSRQMTWNIQWPGQDATQRPPMRRQQPAEGQGQSEGESRAQPPGPSSRCRRMPDAIVTQEAEKHSPCYPETDNEPQDASSSFAGERRRWRCSDRMSGCGLLGDGWRSAERLPASRDTSSTAAKLWDEAKNALAEALEPDRERI